MSVLSDHAPSAVSMAPITASSVSSHSIKSPLCSKRITIVGAFGLVGREVLGILESLGVPIENISALGSARSAGTRLPFGGGELSIDEVSEKAFDACDVALFCTDAKTAHRFAPVAIARGVRVVDNSSAFRLDDSVPLVIPEINGAELGNDAQLAANPNCSTIIMLMAIEPIRRAFGVSTTIVSTYQAASGAGRAALDELRSQTAAVLEDREAQPRSFPVPCAFNVFPHESAVDSETGLNVEESKIIAEARKILSTPRFDVAPTCVRVPVERCHSQSIVLELDRPATLEEVAEVAHAFPGVVFHADPALLVTPRDVAGTDLVSISRARLSGDGRRLSIWVCGDQLRKGAALNAIQIAERLVAL